MGYLKSVGEITIFFEIIKTKTYIRCFEKLLVIFQELKTHHINFGIGYFQYGE